MDEAPFPGTASPFTMRGGPLLPSTALFAGTGAAVGSRWCSQQVIFLDPFLAVGHGQSAVWRNARVGPQANRPWTLDLPQVEGFDVSFDAHN